MKTALCNSAKLDFMSGVHLPTDRYAIALYSEDAKLDETTKNYSTTNEVEGFGYTEGGKFLGPPAIVLKNGEARMMFPASHVWENASISARGAMIYNTSKENKALAVFDFGKLIVSTSGPFTVNIPNEGAIILE